MTVQQFLKIFFYFLLFSKARRVITHTLFFYIRIQFIRILRLRFGTNFLRKWGNICPLQKKSMSNETASQKKQFKYIFRAGVSGISPKIGLEFKNDREGATEILAFENIFKIILT